MRKSLIHTIITASLLLMSGCASASAKINVKVIDTSPPVLKVTNKEVAEGDVLKVSDLYTVEDNATRKPDISIEGDFTLDTDLSELKPGEYTAVITATDKQGNSTDAEVKVTVQEKPKEPDPEPAPEPEQNNTSNITQTQPAAPVQPQPVTPTPVQPTPQPTPDPPAQTAPSAPATTKDFLFSDGYNMQTAMPACQAFSANYAGYTGTRSCQPLQGSDGIYTGVRFTYTPG